MIELVRYRRANDLPALPREGERTPLLMPVIGPAQPMGRSAIHELVKETMRRTASRLRAHGPEHEAAAAHVERASTHWMRHTAGSHQSDRIDLKVVRDNLGHTNIATTSVYLHAQDDVRHDVTTGAHRLGWRTP